MRVEVTDDEDVGVAVGTHAGRNPDREPRPVRRERRGEDDCLFDPSSRIRSPVPFGWAIISFADPGTPLSVRNMIHWPSGE